MNKVECKYLVSIGLDFPSTNEELTAFEEVFGHDTVQLEENSINPFKILDAVNKSTINNFKTLNPSQSYFRRAVLAAKIAHEYHLERTFGVVKFQKMVYLAEQTSSMNFASNYRKQAAGPMDHRFIHSIKGEFERQKWFTVKKEGEFNKWVFTPSENVSAYESYYLSYFDTEIDNIQFLIDSFRFWKTEKVELVATVYSCWAELIKSNTLINDAILIEKFYSFHKAKSKFTRDEILKAICWMKENGVHPS